MYIYASDHLSFFAAERWFSAPGGREVRVKEALAYVRVSTAERVKGGVSLDDQEERIRAYSKMSGLNLAAGIHEEGVSAAKPLAD